MKTTLIDSKGNYFSNLSFGQGLPFHFTKNIGRCVPISEQSANILVEKYNLSDCKLVNFHNHSQIIKTY